MTIQFPIFLQDTDGYMYKVDSADDLGSVEVIDVEEDEYRAWDAVGLPVALYVDAGRIRVRAIASEPNVNELRAAILRYARLVLPGSGSDLQASYPHITELFAAIERGQARK